MVTEASGSLFDYLYLENSEHERYGPIIKSMGSQKSLGNNKYPKNVVETNNVLSNHKFDINKHKKQDHKHQKSNKNKGEKKG